MKTKETLETTKTTAFETTLTTAKAKSLRPMRSLVAKRSFKPRTTVANMILVKSEETTTRA